MAKVPVAGRVKTRLARELGVATATRFARHATMAVPAHTNPVGLAFLTRQRALARIYSVQVLF
jgi:glycosyltransferase A (GT-A) superfamily protein (DUF2064 family)